MGVHRLPEKAGTIVEDRPMDEQKHQSRWRDGTADRRRSTGKFEILPITSRLTTFILTFQMSQTMLDPFDPSDKRPKLERARSAAEKENNPMQRSGSQLRRQYSQQDPPVRRMSQSDSGVDISTGPQQARLPMPRMHPGQVGQYGQHPQHPGLPQPPMQQNPYGHHQSHMNPQVQITRPSGNVSMGGYGQEDPSYYQVGTLSPLHLFRNCRCLMLQSSICGRVKSKT